MCNFLWIFALLVALVLVSPALAAPNVKCVAHGAGLAGGSPHSNISFTLHVYEDASTFNYNGYASNFSLWLNTPTNTILDPSLYDLPPTINDNGDGTYLVTYSVQVYGTFYLNVQFNGVEIPQSPFRSEFTGPLHPCGEGDCFGHGICHTNGSCICDLGYTNSCSIALGPTCYKAQILPYGTSLNLYFAPAVNIGGMSGCSDLFGGDTLVKFGAFPTCEWQDATMLKVTLGSSATLLPGDSIVIMTSSLVARHSPSLVPAPTANVVVESPPASSILVPVGIVSAPTIHNPCADLVLDATASYNSGGRPMSYVWQLHSNLDRGGIVSNFLGTITSRYANSAVLMELSNHSIAIIPYKYTTQLVPGSYLFTLNLTNYLGATSSVNIIVKFASTQHLDVRVTPAVLYVEAGGIVDIAGIVSFPLPECTGTQYSSQLSYSWIRKSGPFIGLDASSNARVLHIHRGQLIADQTYEFELLVSSGGATGVAVAIVHVTAPVVSVHILGGDRALPLGVDLSIEAEVFTNSKNASSNIFTWSVIDTTTNSYIAQDIEAPGKNVIPASFFYPGEFQVIVSLISSSHELVASDAVKIQVTDLLTAPLVLIKAPTDIPAGANLVLEAVLVANSSRAMISYAWASEDLDVQNDANVITPYNSRVLVIPSTSLRYGATMSFSVTVTSSAVQQTGWAEVHVTVGDAPSSGTCNLTPSVGIAFTDVFSLVCQGWEGVTQPLTVRARRLVSNSTMIPLQLSYEPIGTTSFFLPAGSHTLLVTVVDRAGNAISSELQVGVAYSNDHQSILEQNPMLLVGSLMDELQFYINTNNFGIQMQLLPGIIDVLNYASSKATTPTGKGFAQRVSARDTLCNATLHLPQTSESLSALVSYLLSQLGAYPSEISVATLARFQSYVAGLSAGNSLLDYNTVQAHLGAVSAYGAAALERDITSLVSTVASNAVHALSKAALATIYLDQAPQMFTNTGLQLCLLKGQGDGAECPALEVSLHSTTPDTWVMSVISWPYNTYTDTRVSSGVYEISYVQANPNGAIYGEIVLPILTGVDINNDSVIQCNVWNDSSLSWTNNTCAPINSSAGFVSCGCTLSAPTTVVSVYVEQRNHQAVPSTTGKSSSLSVKFSMLTGVQWAIIIGVGMFAVAALLGSFILVGKQVKHTHGFISLRPYNDIMQSAMEEPDVTIEDLSVIPDYPSDAESFSEESSHSEVDTLSEAEELGKVQNSTRLARMGQEGATGYVVSSTTLRNTLETDYDLERNGNTGPITGTALRIRAHSISADNAPGSNPPNPPNFSTASRFTLTAARAKLSAPSISRANLAFTRGDSLRAIPTPWVNPGNTK